MNIISRINEVAQQHFNDDFIDDTFQKLTYGQFLEKVDRMACFLSNAHCFKEPIAIYTNRGVDTVLSMIAVLKAGCFYVVLDSEAPMARTKKILEVTGPKKIIIHNNLIDEFNKKTENLFLDKLILVEDSFQEVSNAHQLKEIEKKVIDTDPAYILFTSGSTGTPKGALITHLNILEYINWFIGCFNINEESILGNQTPFYFSMSTTDVYSCLFTGAKLNIIPRLYFSFPAKLALFLNEKKVNTIYWVPSAYAIVANLDLFKYLKFEFLKLCMFAGEVMQVKYLNYFRKYYPNAVFANLFGPTETVDICTYYIVDRELSLDESIPIGKSCENLDTFLINESGHPCSDEEIGELYVRGSFVCSGYYHNEESTKKSFVQNPLISNYKEIVYKTGDLCKKNKEGDYLYVSRKDFQIKHLGYRIELGEIEASLIRMDGINSCCAVYDEINDEIILVVQANQKIEDIIFYLKNQLPYYMIPSKVVKTSQMRYNQNGKIDRKWFKNHYQELF